MGKEWVCEICGRPGLPSEPAALSNGMEPPEGKVELTSFSMGAYAIRACAICRQELGEDGLRRKLREKVRRMEERKG